MPSYFCRRVPVSLADPELPPILGWTASEFGGDCHVIDNGLAGGIAPREGGFTHPRVYFATDDIDNSVRGVHELGGTAQDVQTVPGVGRLVHCHDDQGTPFSLTGFFRSGPDEYGASCPGPC